MRSLPVFIFATLSTTFLFAQEPTVDNFKKENLNWFDKDYSADKIVGASIDKTYQSLLSGLKVQDTIIVAVIDGGVDIYHEDLQGRIWVNRKEIPGNNIDDDGNGYVDDINGWNFLGGKNGENVGYENYEFTRVYKGKDKSSKYYSVAKELYEKEMTKRQADSDELNKFEATYKKCLAIIRDKTSIEVKSHDDLKKVTANDPSVQSAKNFLELIYSRGFSEKDLKEEMDRNNDFFKYYLNVNFNARAIVGDDPFNLEDRKYGNSNVKGPWANHGTSVAGVIAAIRTNDKGIKGIAENVRIMSLRVVPNGDERDKDIALAIMYAVDNGARVINMSFGKKISPNKEFVDQAVKYAEKHNVLLVHAAGNDAENLAENEDYPDDMYKDGTEATNWLDVGASAMARDKYMPASFSNYGKKEVDLFAPGVDMISLDTSNTYSMHDGTSIAAPVVSGVAALLLSYFPQLTPQQLISILTEGSFKVTKPKKMYMPGFVNGKRVKTKFSELSVSGGVVNAYQSFLIAMSKYKR